MAWSPPADLLHRITDAVEARGGKRTRGDEWRFTCPSHDDEHASADWNAATGVWHCMACDAGGGAFDLARQLGVDVPSSGAPPTRRRTRRSRGGGGHPPPPPPPAGLPDDEAWARLVSQLVDHDSDAAQEARDYLTRLGIDPAETGWGLSRLTAETAQTLGLGRGAVGLRYVIPIHDPLTGQLVDVRRYAGGFETSGAKCLPWRTGSGDTRPYGWDRIADAPLDEPVIWVEGEKDCETLRALGHLAVSHTNGANGGRKALGLVPDELLAGRRIILWFDHDRAGEQGAEKLRAALRERGVTTAVMEWPAGTPDTYDVSDLVLRDGPEAVRDLVRWRLEVAEWDVPPTPRPELSTDGRQLAEVVDEALDLLRRSNDPPTLYLRGGRMVRVERDETGWPLIADVGEHALRGRLARVAEWTGSRGRPIDPPAAVSQTILHEPDLPLPPLVGITQVPTIRPDGTVLSEPGYDAPTHLVYAPPPGLAVPPVPVEPSEAEVAAAKETLLRPVADFPFVDDASRANLLALWLTPVIRAAVGGPVPLAAVDAPTPGTGKSLLVEVVYRSVSGRSVAMTAPETEDEWRKRLTSLLMAGASIVCIDNIKGKLASDALASVLTVDWWEDRELGRTGMLRVQQRATWVATGNNLSLSGDLPRRCYWIRLDARVARPQEREGFAIGDLRRYIDRHRGEILAALLTLARAWYAAGQPAPADTPRLGGFERWVTMVAGILAYAGVVDFMANQSLLYEQADDGSSEMEAFLRAWHRIWGEEPVRVAQLVGALDDEDVPAVQELRDCWPSWGLGSGGHADARRFGVRLRQYVDRRYGSDGIRLARAEKDSHSKTARWQVMIDAGSAGSCGCFSKPVSGNGDDPFHRGSGGKVPQNPALPATDPELPLDEPDTYDPFGTEEPYRG